MNKKGSFWDTIRNAALMLVLLGVLIGVALTVLIPQINNIRSEGLCGSSSALGESKCVNSSNYCGSDWSFKPRNGSYGCPTEGFSEEKVYCCVKNPLD